MVVDELTGTIEITSIADIRRFVRDIARPWTIINAVINGICLVAMMTSIIAMFITTNLAFGTFSIMHTAFAFVVESVRFYVVPVSSNFFGNCARVFS